MNKLQLSKFFFAFTGFKYFILTFAIYTVLKKKMS